MNIFSGKIPSALNGIQFRSNVVIDLILKYQCSWDENESIYLHMSVLCIVHKKQARPRGEGTRGL